MERFGFVAIVGRPNVGKSTLMNHLLGQKLSITSRKPQTTRNRILGIDTRGEYQICYVDTPGLHREEKRAVNRLMNRAAESSLGDVGLVLFLTDAARWTDDDDLALARVRRAGLPTLLVINKIDRLQDRQELLPLIDRLSKLGEFREIIPISALKGDNVRHLAERVREFIPEGRHLFPDDILTDRPARFLAAEIVREKLTRQMGDELPYSCAVEIEEFSEEEQLIRISAAILVERAGQKKMVVGAGGRRVRRIGTEARLDMERLFGNRVFLRLFVKVKAGWADDARALRSLGYAEREI